MDDFEKLEKLLPTELKKISHFISTEGFILSLVGGVVRDFLIYGTLSKDIDIEIKHALFIDQDRWIKKLFELFSSIHKKFGHSFEDKGMGVYAISMSAYTIEFSSPRIETFMQNDRGHKNFELDFLSNLSYKEAFYRRDFTINSIALTWSWEKMESSFKIQDPYNGKVDLKNKVIRHIGKDFTKDPVRILRLIRFKNKLDFKVSSSTDDLIKKFNLSKVSNYYFHQEFCKSKSINYFKDFYKYIKDFNIPVNLELLELKVLAQVSEASFYKGGDEEVLRILLNHDLSREHKEKYIKYINYSKKKAKLYIDLFEVLKHKKRDVKSMDLISGIYKASSNLYDKVDIFISEHLLVSYINEVKKINFLSPNQYKQEKKIINDKLSA